jgi:hypothetical protein
LLSKIILILKLHLLAVPTEARMSEGWHPLHHSLLNQTAPFKYPLSMMQTLFAEFNM